MPRTADTAPHGAGTGSVRRFWWRTSQSTRLAIGCLGVLTALATTGAVGFGGAADPRERGSAGAEHRGDSLELTVHTVSDVDLFEGAEPVTGRFVRARVAGLHRITDCWEAESRATAQDLLRGKNVRLVVRKDDASDRMLVDVALPDGADYARTVVGEGVVAADLSARGELEPLEAAARQERRGLWSADCVDAAEVTVSSAPPSSTSTTPSPTTTTPVTTTTESSAHPPSSSRPTSSTPPDDEWDDFRLGKLCLIEGARKKNKDGNELICARNARNQLRWRRAD